MPFLDWISIGDFNVDWAFRVDTLSVTMMLVVAGVGTLIHIYAIGYMHEDVRHNGDPGRFRRFFVYLNLFIAAMMILVSADNYLMLFVGWEGVGLCSYLLIGFWFEKGEDGIGNAQAAKKAFVVNRIGDFGLLIALFLMFWQLRHASISTQSLTSARGRSCGPGVLLAITLFMLLGVTGKSAQIAAVRLAAGCHGRPDPGFGADPCRHHGHRGCVPGGAFSSRCISLVPAAQACGDLGGCADRPLCRHHRRGAV